MTNKKINKGKVLALLSFCLILIGLIVFLFSGKNFDVLKEIFNTNATKQEIQDSISKLGLRAYIVVFLLSMIQVVFTFVPAEPLHVISGLSFGLWKGMTVCLLGIMAGNTIIYILYKIFGTKITDYFKSNVDFDFETAKTSNKIALIVIILYCLPAIPYGIICFFAATLGIKYPKYILITGIGSIPSLFLDVGLGHVTMSTSWIVSIIVFVAIIVLLILVMKFKSQIFTKVNEFIYKSKEKEKNRVGKYNKFLTYTVGLPVLANVKSKTKIKIKNNVGKLEKPCVVLCTHGSFYDFVFSGVNTVKYQPHYVVSRMYFQHKFLKWALEKTGAFPKSLMIADTENVKNCLKVINGKGMLVMMPEARLSTVGKFEEIQDSCYKFLKKMNVTVYTVNVSGSYLFKPKWSKSMRKGGIVEGELNQLFSAGELENISLEEIQEKVDKALYYNDWEWLEKHPEISYKNKDLAEGLENILTTCPNCKSKFTLTTNKKTITCESCGHTITLDNRYALSNTEFKNISEWYDWQMGLVRAEIDNNPDYALTAKVELRHFSKIGKSFTDHAGYGVCKFDRTGLTYTGTDNGNEVEKFFPMETIYRVLFGAGEDFEIYEGKDIYYFVPEDKRSCVEWYIVSKLLKEATEK